MELSTDDHISPLFQSVSNDLISMACLSSGELLLGLRRWKEDFIRAGALKPVVGADCKIVTGIGI